MTGRFPNRRAVQVLLPAAAARRLCDEAVRAFGPRAVDHQATRLETTIPVWRGHDLGSPIGNCKLSWDRNSGATATLSEVGWGDDRGASYTSVSTAINSLAGWPILR